MTTASRVPRRNPTAPTPIPGNPAPSAASRHPSPGRRGLLQRRRPPEPWRSILAGLPNALTGSRAVLGVAWLGVALAGAATPAWMVAWMLAGLADAVDGPLARWLGAESWVGTWLDPVSDKVHAWCGWVAFAWLGGVPWMAPVWIIGRDVIVIAFWLAGLERGVGWTPSAWGRARHWTEGAAFLAAGLAWVTGSVVGSAVSLLLLGLAGAFFVLAVGAPLRGATVAVDPRVAGRAADGTTAFDRLADPRPDARARLDAGRAEGWPTAESP